MGAEALQTDPQSEAESATPGDQGEGVLLSSKQLGGTLLDGRAKGRRTLKRER